MDQKSNAIPLSHCYFLKLSKDRTRVLSVLNRLHLDKQLHPLHSMKEPFLCCLQLQKECNAESGWILGQVRAIWGGNRWYEPQSLDEENLLRPLSTTGNMFWSGQVSPFLCEPQFPHQSIALVLVSFLLCMWRMSQIDMTTWPINHNRIFQNPRYFSSTALRWHLISGAIWASIVKLNGNILKSTTYCKQHPCPL